MKSRLKLVKPEAPLLTYPTLPNLHLAISWRFTWLRLTSYLSPGATKCAHCASSSVKLLGRHSYSLMSEEHRSHLMVSTGW